MRRLDGLLLASILIWAGFAFAIGPARPAIAAQPTLEGERLIAGPGETGGTTVRYSTERCSTTEPTRLTFRAQGIAEGPYPGSFVEEGSFTIVPFRERPGLGRLTGFQARFRITSEGTAIVGQKYLQGQRQVAEISCKPLQVSLGPTGFEAISYFAAIQTKGGRFLDRGTVSTLVSNPADFALFNETFASALEAARPAPGPERER